jgi:hypothetical protein
VTVSRAAALAALACAAPACWWIRLDPSGKVACESERDCIAGYRCVDHVCTSGDGSRADGGDGADAEGPAADAQGPASDAALGCGFGPGGDGCVCGFRELVPVDEWPGYQIDCDFFGDFCGRDCCPPGTWIDADDPTSCVAAPARAPDVHYFGPWPDHADPASAMRLWWIVYGAETCSVTVSIDGATPVVRVGQPGVGQLAIDELAGDIDQAALEASIECSNRDGPAAASYSIPAAAERVTVTGLGGGFPQEVMICWQVLPFFVAAVPPYQRGACEVGLCPAGVEFDPSSTVPCFAPSFSRSFSQASACVTSDVPADVGDRAYVSCETGDVQTAVHQRLVTR